MTSVPSQNSMSATSRPSSGTTHAHANGLLSNGSSANGAHDYALTDAPVLSAPHPSSTGKKAKSKRPTDPNETSKLLAAKISQLEIDKASEKDQEVEIEREVKKANRDLANLLSTIDSPLSRIDIVQKRYSDLLGDMKRLDRDHAKNKKRSDQLQKDKDQSRSELSKTVSLKERLEKLCRELQRENKKMKDEHKKIIESETLQRKRLNDQFDSVLWEVQDVIHLHEIPASQKQTMDTDEIFRQKFKSFIDQYELREIHFHSMLRAKELEVQFNMAKYEQQKKVAEQEAARSRALSTQVSTFSQTEGELRSQLNIYVEKFKQVEDTLNNSNDLFLTFRKEMEEMSKKTKRLEKENLTLTRKHDLTNRNIIEMAEERTRLNKDLELLRKKNGNLEKLCRGMQAQGRAAPGMATLLAEADAEAVDELATESEYEYEDDGEEDEGHEDEDKGDDGGDNDVRSDGAAEGGVDDGNPNVQGDRAAEAQAAKAIGLNPLPPPPPPKSRHATNGKANGASH
ncbi:MAG: hypothetical protein M1838_002719 [Thelocarpon superellum]|nr:MAG: hypothetical protein M1838_002719 [Thelocarpon superellum]